MTEVWIIDDCHIPRGIGNSDRKARTEIHPQSQVAKSIKHAQIDHDVSVHITVVRYLTQVLRRSQQDVPSVTMSQRLQAGNYE